MSRIKSLKKSNLRLLAFDIDGTLLNREGKVNPAVRERIIALKDKGLYVTLATGRIWDSVVELKESLMLTEPLILHNGALIQEPEGGRIISARPIELAKNGALIEFLMAREPDSLFCSLCRGEDQILYHREPKHPWAKYFMESYPEQVAELDGRSLEKRPLLRILIYGELNSVQGLRDELQEKDWGLKLLFFPGPERKNGYLEIFNQDCSKASGLQLLCQRLGVKPREIIAFGDDVNDLEMLEYAGLGVAMASAPSRVKDRADLVISSSTGDDLEGVLDRYLLNKKTFKEEDPEYECL